MKRKKCIIIVIILLILAGIGCIVGINMKSERHIKDDFEKYFITVDEFSDENGFQKLSQIEYSASSESDVIATQLITDKISTIRINFSGMVMPSIARERYSIEVYLNKEDSYTMQYFDKVCGFVNKFSGKYFDKEIINDIVNTDNEKYSGKKYGRSEDVRMSSLDFFEDYYVIYEKNQNRLTFSGCISSKVMK